jgi:hypothetical protein
MVSESPWPIEHIPNDSHVYLRVHPNNFDRLSGEPFIAAVFQNHGNGMSCDWSKYRSKEETRDAGTGNLEPGMDYCVLTLEVSRIRALEHPLPGQSVDHDPRWEGPGHPDNNRAHSLIRGAKSSRDGLPKSLVNRIRLAFKELVEGQSCIPEDEVSIAD